MNQRLAAILGLVVALAGAALLATWNGGRRTGFPAMDFDLPALDGTRHRLSDYRGKVVFLNVWATWCPPCREEMPSMQTLHTSLPKSDFVMLAVSVDTLPDAALQSFARDLRLTFPILRDPDSRIASSYGVTGFPETFIIDRQGQVVRHIIGPEKWDSPAAMEYFRQLLAPGGTP